MKTHRHLTRGVGRLALTAGLLAGSLGIGTASAATGLPFPGDATIGTAFGDQFDPVIVKGGDMYLAVWADDRADRYGIGQNYYPPSGEPGGQTLIDVYAVRLDSAGKVIDPTPIIVSQARWDQARPDVAWNGESWLVVWQTTRVSAYSDTSDVVGARVATDGAVLDPEPIQIDATDEVYETSPKVASDGLNWAVFWGDEGEYFEIDAARVDPDGVLLDPGGIPVYTPPLLEYPYSFDVVFAKDEYFLVWSTTDIKAMRLTPELDPLGAQITVSAAQYYQYVPAVATNGNDFFVVWHDERLQGDIRVYGARVSHSGQVRDKNGIDLSGQGYGNYPTPDVIWDGKSWFAAWDDYGDYVAKVKYATVGQQLGRVTARGILHETEITAQPPSIAPGPTSGSARIVWTDWGTNSVDEDVYTTTWTAGSSVPAPTVISLGAPTQTGADMVANGSGYLVVFESITSTTTRVVGQRLNAAGDAIDAAPFYIGDGYAPAVAWNGSTYLVVWSGAGGVNARRLKADATSPDAKPIVVMPGGAPDVAVVGDTFLVTGIYSPVHEQQYTYAVRVRGTDGAKLDLNPVQVSENFTRRQAVTGLTDRFLVVYERWPTHDNSRSEVKGTFVSTAGARGPGFMIDSTDFSKTPDVAAGANGAMVVWHLNGDIRARKVFPDGTQQAIVQVTSAHNSQLLPSIAWDGSQFVVVYEDYRNIEIEWDKPVSDVFATRLSQDGSVLDPDGIQIAARISPEIRPTVAGFSNQSVAVLSSFVPEAPFASYRLIASVVKSAVQGDTVAPVISNVRTSNVVYNGATVSWTTSEGSTSQVEYGKTTAYGAVTAFDPTLTAAHTVAITGLAPATTYHFRVRSSDPAGNLSISPDYTFTTPVTDSITITQATWTKEIYGVLTVSATGSNPGAVLTVYSKDGGYYGEMKNLGNGKYTQEYSSPSNPGAIEVRSSLGGVATATIAIGVAAPKAVRINETVRLNAPR